MTRAEDLFLLPKMGIVPEVSAQNYDTLAKALREYISNAMDAGAKNAWITFTADSDGSSRLDIRDGGRGMSLEQLRNEFLALGGSHKHGDPATVGRIGIGFLAIVPLCDRIVIHTKARNAKQAVRATIHTDTMLPIGVRYEQIATKPIGTAELLSPSTTASLVDDWGDSFTAFSLEGLRGDVRETFGDDEAQAQFREELRLILPLPWPEKGPLAGHISKKLWKTLQVKAAENCIAVQLNGKDLERRIYGENTTRENFLYTQEFDNTLVLPARSDIDQPESIHVTGFLVCDEPSSEVPVGRKLTGITTRVLNVAVEEDTFFGLSGREERKKRVAGEFFIDGLDATKAITINRNAFTETHRPVQVFREEMQVHLTHFFSGMNRIWRARTVINKEIKRVRGIVSGVDAALASIASQGALAKPAKASAAAARSLMQHRNHKYFPIRAGAGLTVRPSTDLEPRGKTPYRIQLAHDPTEGVSGRVEISRELLHVASKRFDIGGLEFGLRVVEAADTDPPCEIDIQERFVVLNANHALILSGDHSVVQMLIYLKYGVQMCQSAKDLARYVVDLLSHSLT